MNELKNYFKSKEFIICIFIILILTSFNIFDFFKNGYPNSTFENEANCFGFWNYVLHYNAGSALMFLSPFIIAILSTESSYYKISGSFLKNALLRKKYIQFIKKELYFSYIKAWIPFLINSCIVFLIGYIFLSHNIPNNLIADQYFNFDYSKTINPYLFIILYNISLLLYVIMIVNLSYIIIRIIKKLNISIILTFISLNALNFIIGNILLIIGNLLKNEQINNYFHQANIYDSYIITSNIYEASINTLILIIISLVILSKLYKNKERLVLDFE